PRSTRAPRRTGASCCRVMCGRPYGRAAIVDCAWLKDRARREAGMSGLFGRRYPPAPSTPPPTPKASVRAVAVIVWDGAQPVVGADVYLDDVAQPNGPGGHHGFTNQDGYVVFPEVSAGLSPANGGGGTFISVTAAGFAPYLQHYDPRPGNVDVCIGVPASR